MRIASDFGASSPTTMCRKEITQKANTKDDAVDDVGRGHADGRSSGSSRPAKAGSPTQPRPSEASVMPSWQADR
jgi:hypothetical protein